jgi:U1 small nuclear ribonucleoprotein
MLQQEFEFFGPVTNVHVVHDMQGRSRGYGFVEFSNGRDLEQAYHKAHGTRLAGRRIVVDMEYGRTREHWRPRRLGGGKGNTRASAEEKLREKQARQREEEQRRERERRERGRGHGGRDRDHRHRGDRRY